MGEVVIGAELTVYDGAGCIGGNKIYLRCGDTGVFLDFGMNFGANEAFFEEFLQFRAHQGILDLGRLGLLPLIEGLYRPDAIPDHSDLALKRGLPVNAVFVSHAHVDHTGYIGLLNPSIPVYSSLMSAVISKTMQDSGQSTLGKEVANYKLRIPCKSDGRAITSDRSGPRVGRTFRILDAGNLTPASLEYWRTSYSPRSPLEAEDLKPAGDAVGEIKFESYPVDHSIYGAYGFIFYCGDRTVAYTGDMRLHGRRSELTKRYIARLVEVRPDYLVIEGTNMGQAKGNDTETGARISEDDVYRNCLAAVQDASGELVVADFGPRNIDRLLIFLQIAKETGRRLVITAKDAFLLLAMSKADDSLPDIVSEKDILIFDSPQAKTSPWESGYIRQELGARYTRPEEVKSAPDKYILALSFFDMPNLLDIGPIGGSYIYSTCEAFNEDMMADVWRLSHWLTWLRLRPVGFSLSVNKAEPSASKIHFDQKGYHASGHLSMDEIVEVIDQVQPGAVIPIHTEHPEMFETVLGGRHKIIVPEPGRPIEL